MVAISLGACATLGIGQARKAKIPIAACPQEQLWKASQFSRSGEEWKLDDRSYRELTQWIRDWQTCAKARGAAIEEVNR